MATIKKLRTKERLNHPTKNKYKYSKTFEVRDLRERNYFTVDDLFLDDRWLKLLKGCPAAVYFALCRHVDKGQQCFPSMSYLSEETGYGERQCRRSIRTLEFHNLIEVDRERGDHNIYGLINRKHWKKLGRVPMVGVEDIDAMTYVGDQQEPFPVRKGKTRRF